MPPYVAAPLGAEVTGFDTDREVFVGGYRTYANPAVVESGRCTGSLAVSDNGCGTFQAEADLQPGESREIAVLLGLGEAAVEGARTVAEFSAPGAVHAELRKLKQHWHGRLHGLAVSTPDAEFNSMMNMWSPYNCLISFAWSRAASFVYTAHNRDGLGYRDSVQDLPAVFHLIPAEARQRMELMLTAQVSNGGAMPEVKPFDHRPGCEQTPDEAAYRADDCLWLFNAVEAYVKETGDLAFYEKTLPYADRGRPPCWATCGRPSTSTSSVAGPTACPAGCTPIGTTACVRPQGRIDLCGLPGALCAPHLSGGLPTTGQGR